MTALFFILAGMWIGAQLERRHQRAHQRELEAARAVAADRDHARPPRVRAPREHKEPRPAGLGQLKETTATARMARDVELALTTAGYGRTEAHEAVQACEGTQRSTIEAWTRAALRNLRAGAVS